MRGFEYFDTKVKPLFLEFVSSGDIKQIKSMLEKYGKLFANNVWVWSRGFEIAKQNNNKEMLRFLMQQSCDPELLTQASYKYDSSTPLHLAVANGHNDIIQLFIDEGFDCRPLDGFKLIPLSRALYYDSFEALQLCLKHKEKFGTEQDYIDLLVECSRGQDARHIRLLLENGVSVTDPSKDGINALQAVVLSNKKHMLNAILKANPSQSEIIGMFDFAVDKLDEGYTKILIDILSRFKMFDFVKKDEAMSKKWLKKIAENLENICYDLRMAESLKSSKVVVDLLNAFASTPIDLVDDVCSKLQNTVLSIEKSIIMDAKLFMRAIEPDEDLASLYKFVNGASYIKESIYFVNLAKRLDNASKLEEINNSLNKLIHKGNILIKTKLWRIVQIMSDQKFKSLGIYNKIQEIRENTMLEQKEKDAQISKLMQDALEGKSPILPQGTIFNILQMLGKESLNLKQVSKYPCNVFEKESYMNHPNQDVTSDGLIVGENYTDIEDILT